MTDFPVRGQKAPDFWDVQLRDYIDEGDAGSAVVTPTDVIGLREFIEDAVATMIVSGANVTLNYVDNGTAPGTLTVTAVGGGDAEVMRDTIGTALVGISGVGVAINDGADTITISVTSITIAQVTGLQAALDAHTSGIAAKMDAGIAGLPSGSVIVVKKDPTTGFWPSGWNADFTPIYTGGSASAGVRPTSRAGICVMWKGPDPSPAIVTTGAGGMRDQTGGAVGDMRVVTP